MGFRGGSIALGPWGGTFITLGKSRGAPQGHVRTGFLGGVVSMMSIAVLRADIRVLSTKILRLK